MLNLVNEWPSSKPWCCDQTAWNQLNSGSSGLDTCTAPAGFNQDPCAGSGETNWNGKLPMFLGWYYGLSSFQVGDTN